MANNKNNNFEISLNLNVRGLPQSATLSINEKSAKLRSEGKKVYKLGLGQSPFPVPKPVVDELKVNAFQKDYLPVKGLPGLRKAVADYHQRVHGITRNAEDVLIGPGSKELMFLLQLVYYGDLVIPMPSWVSYAPQAHIIGRHVRWLQTQQENEWKLTPEELDKLCEKDLNKPRIIILNYPSNPTGNTYKIDELKKLAAVAKKHKAIVLSDEIYGELHFKGQHISIARFYPEGTIISGGLSKWCGAGGWRLGTFTFPPTLRWLLDALSVVASETFTSTSAPIQYAAIRAFQGGIEMEEYLMQERRILKALGYYITDKLNQNNIKTIKPKGGFYIFPDFDFYKEKLSEKGITSSEKLCNKILEETGVAMLPGSVFGRPENELTVRIAYVDFDGAKALKAAEQIPATNEINGEFIEIYCRNVVESIDIICEWVKK